MKENFSVNENSGSACPDVHDLLVKTWSVPQSGTRPLSDAGYVLSRGWGGSPKGMCACPPSRRLSPHIWHIWQILGSDISLPFKLCKMTPMTIRMTIWPARLTARPASEQCRVATHTGYSCTSFVGALVDQVAKAAMSIQCRYVSYGSYSRDLALGPRCDKT